MMFIQIKNLWLKSEFLSPLLLLLFLFPSPALARDWWIYDAKTGACQQADSKSAPETLTQKYPNCVIQGVNMGQGLMVLNCSKQKEVGKTIIYGNSRTACLAVAKRKNKT